MGAFRIRPALATDIETLCLLYVGFHDHHAGQVPDRLKPCAPNLDRTHLRAAITTLMGRSDAALLVAETDERVVGLAEVYLCTTAATCEVVARRFAHLQSLMVDDTRRRRGIGRALLGAAEAWARERGATEMDLDTWEHADGPLRFYEAVGYQTCRRTWTRRL